MTRAWRAYAKWRYTVTDSPIHFQYLLNVTTAIMILFIHIDRTERKQQIIGLFRLQSTFLFFRLGFLFAFACVFVVVSLFFSSLFHVILSVAKKKLFFYQFHRIIESMQSIKSKPKMDTLCGCVHTEQCSLFGNHMEIYWLGDRKNIAYLCAESIHSYNSTLTMEYCSSAHPLE